MDFFFLNRDLHHVILEHGLWSVIDKYQRLMEGISAVFTVFCSGFQVTAVCGGLSRQKSNVAGKH